MARSKWMDGRPKNVQPLGSRAAYTINKVETKAMEEKDIRMAQSEKANMVKMDIRVAPEAELVER